MQWYPKKLKDALLPILVTNWILGLGIAECPLGTPRFMFSLIYLIILLSGYFYVPLTEGFYVCNINNNPSPGALLLNIMSTYYEFPVVICIIICWNHQKMLESCIRRIELIDETLECLGSKDNWGIIFKRGLLKLFLLFILYCFLIVNNILWLNHINFPHSLYCVFKYQVPIVFAVIIDYTFGMFVGCIGLSMKRINLLLESAIKNKSKLEINYPVNRKHHRIISLIMSSEFNSETTEKTKNLIQLLKQLHLELSKVGWDLNKIYGLTITLVTFESILFLILDSYYVFSTVINVRNYDYTYFVSLMCTVSSVLLNFGRIINLNTLCGVVAKEARKAKEIIFEVNKGNNNIELTEEIEQFVMQIDQRPLTFSMCGLFTLDQNFIGNVRINVILIFHLAYDAIKLITTSVTYLACMLQLGPLLW